MEVNILKLDPATFDTAVEISLACLRTPGSVLLVPTETVYGLVCAWNDPAGIEKIYHLKSRDRGKPLAMFADGLPMLERYGIAPETNTKRLIKDMCPGPITLILEDIRGQKTGFRIPDHEFILALLSGAAFPLASTSANLSGNPPALSVKDALEQLEGIPDMVIDSGPLPADAAASTVVEIENDRSFRILRRGPVTSAEISPYFS